MLFSNRVKLKQFFLLYLLLILECFTLEEPTESEQCSKTKPIWNKIDGKPSVELNQELNSEVILSWSKNTLLHGQDCIQAFEVEYRQFGLGRRYWSRFWSSLVRCAVVVRNAKRNRYRCSMTLQDIDCGKRLRFRVLAHNIYNVASPVTASEYEEVLVECKDSIKSTTRKAGKLGRQPRKAFYVRTANKERYKATKIGTTTRPMMRWKSRRRTTTTTISTTRRTTASTTFRTTTEKTQTTNTTTKSSVSHGRTKPRINQVITRSKYRRIFLLPGKYAKSSTKKSYEVRHNLKNFTPQQNELKHCARYEIKDTSLDCDVAREIHRGQEVCFLANYESKLPRYSKFFKMTLDPRCDGQFEFLQHLQNCTNLCQEKDSFVVV